MRKPILALLAAGLLVTANAAHAQYGGGGAGGPGGSGGGSGGGGHGHRGNHGGGAPASPSTGTPPPQTERQKPTNQIEIIGVIKAVDLTTQQITIAYDPVEELNWPAGTTPFVVAKSAFLKVATVGQKVRFKLDSQQIVDLRPF